jgi:sarcosine oxidase subunit delta
MRIPCPHCGERDSSEFTFLGDASIRRTARLGGPVEDVCRALYLRDNPAGLHHEIWFHGSGCRACLIVTRDTLSHRIEAVEEARTAGLRRRAEKRA